MKKNREVICAFAAWVLSACFFMSCFMIPGLAEKFDRWVEEEGLINHR